VVASVRLDDPNESGYWPSISLVDDDGRVLWTRTPPTSAHRDVWVQAELKDGQVRGWTWSCYLVTFDGAGNKVDSVFTK
jgi:hypothetical protein